MSSGIVRTYHRENCNPWDCTKFCNEINGLRLHTEYFQNNGVKEGSFKMYHSNGHIYQEYNYINGKINGIAKFFNEAGKIIEEQFYTYGVLDKYIKYIYYEDGSLAETQEEIIDNKN